MEKHVKILPKILLGKSQIFYISKHRDSIWVNVEILFGLKTDSSCVNTQIFSLGEHTEILHSSRILQQSVFPDLYFFVRFNLVHY